MSIEVERSFKPEVFAPARVRSFVSEMLRIWGCDVDENASLLASELVSNVVLHAGTDMKVRLRLDPPILVVEVEDGSSALPEPLAISTESERGRGLVLIEGLSQRWGARRSSTGKTVWFELALNQAGGRLQVHRQKSLAL